MRHDSKSENTAMRYSAAYLTGRERAESRGW